MAITDTYLAGKTSRLLAMIGKRIWFRASLYSVLAVVTALLASIAGPYIPFDWHLKIGADAVDGILGILASSMLAVTTFSLATMVSAYSAATNNVTPRAVRLLIEDRTAQNALSTFLGTFLFSIVALITLAMGAYEAQGRFVLFLATIAIIIVIAGTLMRWIQFLAQFGRVGDTIERVERAAIRTMRFWARAPRLGALPLARIIRPGGVDATQRPVHAGRTGYLQHIDVLRLEKIAEAAETTVEIRCMPGAYIHPTRVVATVSGSIDDEQFDDLSAAFSIGDHRDFDQDPRFGLIVLSEIASRALSPGINDPGTAIQVIGAGLRVLLALKPSDEDDTTADAEHDVARLKRVHAPDLSVDDLFDDFFRPIERDGAAMIEVGLRLQAAFGALAAFDAARFGVAAHRHSAEAIARAEPALALEADRRVLIEAGRAVVHGRGSL